MILDPIDEIYEEGPAMSNGKPLLISRPSNWDEMTEDEQLEWALAVARDLGVPEVQPPANQTANLSETASRSSGSGGRRIR